MLAFAIFLATLVLVIWQPRGLGIGWSALGGAAVALVTGVIDLPAVATVWGIVWDATFTFVALIVISLILDEAGFFAWAALHVARLGLGDGRRLLPLVVGLGALIAAFFANDGAALLLTPIVLAILLKLNVAPAGAFAFTIACGFVADTTSLPLVISNLVNIVTAGYFEIGFARYASVMMPVNLASLVASLAVLALVFHRAIRFSYDPGALEAPGGAIRDPLVFRAAFPLLALLLSAFLVADGLGLPVCVPAGLGALALLATATRAWPGGGKAIISTRRVLADAPWQIVLFSLGMYCVVYGLGEAWLTDSLAGALAWLATGGPLAATIGTGAGVALLASVMNNMPSTLVAALAIERADIAPAIRETMIYASVIGNDLGPKLTPIGSLATLLWLHVLARKGQTIGWLQYMKVGALLTPPVLLVALVALWWRLTVS